MSGFCLYPQSFKVLNINAFALGLGLKIYSFSITTFKIKKSKSFTSILGVEPRSAGRTHALATPPPLSVGAYFQRLSFGWRNSQTQQYQPLDNVLSLTLYTTATFQLYIHFDQTRSLRERFWILVESMLCSVQNNVSFIYPSDGAIHMEYYQPSDSIYAHMDGWMGDFIIIGSA